MEYSQRFCSNHIYSQEGISGGHGRLSLGDTTGKGSSPQAVLGTSFARRRLREATRSAGIRTPRGIVGPATRSVRHVARCYGPLPVGTISPRVLVLLAGVQGNECASRVRQSRRQT